MRKYLPYAPAGMPGVWFTAFQMLPTRSGAYYPNNLFTTYRNVAALTSPGTTLRAWIALRPSGVAISFIGTTTKLWQYDGQSGFTDVSKVGGYTNTATDWSFAQYGDITFATNRVDALQTRDAGAGGSFADASGSPPKARIVVTQSEQVLLFDLNDGTEKADAFAVCAPGDYTDWSGAGATTATRIRHRPGGITAAIAFRDYVLVFKRSSVYKLSYTGSNTFKWRVELIAIGRGAWGKHDVVNCGDEVVFSGPGGAWRFDGATFRSITDWVGEISESQGAFFSPLSQNVHFITKHSLVTYSTALSIDYVDTPEQYTYNLVSDAWGTGCFYDGTEAVNSTDHYVPMTGEPAALASFIAPTAALPDLMWLIDLNAASGIEVLRNTTYWGGGTPSGALGAAELHGGVEGIGGNAITTFTRLTPEFTMSLRDLASNPIPGNTELRLNIITASSTDDLNSNGGATYSDTALSSSTAQRRFDFLRAAVYARFEIYLPQNSGYVEILDYKLDTKQSGVL